VYVQYTHILFQKLENELEPAEDRVLSNRIRIRIYVI
jgi:hypothetical protein